MTAMQPTSADKWISELEDLLKKCKWHECALCGADFIQSPNLGDSLVPCSHTICVKCKREQVSIKGPQGATLNKSNPPGLAACIQCKHCSVVFETSSMSCLRNNPYMMSYRALSSPQLRDPQVKRVKCTYCGVATNGEHKQSCTSIHSPCVQCKHCQAIHDISQMNLPVNPLIDTYRTLASLTKADHIRRPSCTFCGDSMADFFCPICQLRSKDDDGILQYMCGTCYQQYHDQVFAIASRPCYICYKHYSVLRPATRVCMDSNCHQLTCEPHQVDHRSPIVVG